MKPIKHKISRKLFLTKKKDPFGIFWAVFKSKTVLNRICENN